MTTPYERGIKHGTWTPEQLKNAGWNSWEEFVEHEKTVLQEEKENLTYLYVRNTEYARDQALFLEGIEAALKKGMGDGTNIESSGK